MRERPMLPIAASAALLAALAAKPRQLVPVVHTSRHRNSQYDKERAHRIRALDREVRAKTESDVAAIAGAEAKRARKAQKLLASGL